MQYSCEKSEIQCAIKMAIMKYFCKAVRCIVLLRFDNGRFKPNISYRPAATVAGLLATVDCPPKIN